MIDRLTCAVFQPLVGQPFDLLPPDGPAVQIELTSAVEGVPVGAADRVPFSLIFHAPPGPVVPQQICKLRNPDLGDVDLFREVATRFSITRVAAMS